MARAWEEPRGRLASGIFSLQGMHSSLVSRQGPAHRRLPRALLSGCPPSLAAVDWARSTHCSASFSIFEVSGGTVSPASREGTGGTVSPSAVTHVLTKKEL